MQVYNDELSHFGILGMKWGRRKYDGHTLTDKEKKGISKEYMNDMKKSTKKVKSKMPSVYIEAYNKAADDMNNGGIDKFNKQQNTKYGSNYMNRKDYEKDYMDIFNKTLSAHSDVLVSDLYKNDKHFNKGQELVEKYKMLEWNELSQFNQRFIK